MELPKELMAVAAHLERFSGIGKKTAIRHALTLKKWSLKDLQTFSQSIHELQDIHSCPECGFFVSQGKCSLCEQNAQQLGICVVESVIDCLAIARSGRYEGAYHCLGGVLNPLNNIGPNDLLIDKLIERSGQMEEVILAINPSIEGDATCAYIAEKIPSHVRVERIGMGIPVGGNLEYLDVLTISKAFENKRPLEGHAH